MRKFASEVFTGGHILFVVAVFGFTAWRHAIPGMVLSGIGAIIAASTYGYLKQALDQRGE